ncbi:hypothetical protein BD309DRAFT_968247 [Dichomitus squalens]|nr:hypothetical protein BD309DRAFT_968247 [Dichomitus squalens]
MTRQSACPNRACFWMSPTRCASLHSTTCARAAGWLLLLSCAYRAYRSLTLLRRFDLVLSRAFQGRSADVYALTDHVQATLGTRWGGFAPAGTCTLVPLPAGVSGRGGNKWGTHTLAVLPTMKEPEWVGWNRELVYNGMWSLLCEIGRWNEEAEGAGRDAGGSRCLEAKREGEKNGQERIERVVMTGLGTGTGGVSAARCGRQMVLAVKHYLQGLPEKVRWDSAEEKRRMQDLNATIDV